MVNGAGRALPWARAGASNRGDRDIRALRPVPSSSRRRRGTDVFTPVWSNIDGMGNVGTGEYDFYQMSSTRTPTSGQFCAEFRSENFMEGLNPDSTNHNICT